MNRNWIFTKRDMLEKPGLDGCGPMQEILLRNDGSGDCFESQHAVPPDLCVRRRKRGRQEADPVSFFNFSAEL